MIRPDALPALVTNIRGTPTTPPRPQCDLYEWGAICDGCLRRARAWRVPPRWSAGDWFEEIQAQAVAAAWRATRDFDPLRGVPFGAYVRLRVLASVRTRHRQEWAYAVHFGPESVAEPGASPADDPISLAEAKETLRALLAKLPEVDRWLIEHLFWHGCTESEIAGVLGITQQAVSKRKRLILMALRSWMEANGEIPA